MSMWIYMVEIFICIAAALIYWPFMHRVKGGRKLISLAWSVGVVALCMPTDYVLYNAFGGIYFEQIFPQTSRAQEIAKGLYFGGMALLSTVITVLVVRPKSFRHIVWLWSGHQLIAIIGFLINLGVEF